MFIFAFRRTMQTAAGGTGMRPPGNLVSWGRFLKVRPSVRGSGWCANAFSDAENSMDFKGLKTLFSCSFDDWNNHNAPRMGAALAFYTVASISPLVILVLGVVSLVFNKNAAEA